MMVPVISPPVISAMFAVPEEVEISVKS